MTAAENKKRMQDIWLSDGRLKELTEYMDTELVTSAVGELATK